MNNIRTPPFFIPEKVWIVDRRTERRARTVPGQHDRLLSAPGEMRHMNEQEARQIDLNSGELMRTRPGDLVIFDGLTPHRSGPNLSSRLRRQLYLTYSPSAHGDLYQRQLRLLKEGRSSRRMTDDYKAHSFFR